MKCLDMRIRVFLHYRIVYEFSTIKKIVLLKTHTFVSVSPTGTKTFASAVPPLLMNPFIHS